MTAAGLAGKRDDSSRVENHLHQGQLFGVGAQNHAGKQLISFHQEKIIKQTGETFMAQVFVSLVLLQKEKKEAFGEGSFSECFLYARFPSAATVRKNTTPGFGFSLSLFPLSFDSEQPVFYVFFTQNSKIPSHHPLIFPNVLPFFSSSNLLIL